MLHNIHSIITLKGGPGGRCEKSVRIPNPPLPPQPRRPQHFFLHNPRFSWRPPRWPNMEVNGESRLFVLFVGEANPSSLSACAKDPLAALLKAEQGPPLSNPHKIWLLIFRHISNSAITPYPQYIYILYVLYMIYTGTMTSIMMIIAIHHAPYSGYGGKFCRQVRMKSKIRVPRTQRPLESVCYIIYYY